MSQAVKPRKRWHSGPSSSDTSKKKKYSCKFQIEWEKSYSWLKSSSLGNDIAFCQLCSSSFSVAHSGLYDVKRHSECATHKKAVTSSQKLQTIESFILF